MAYCDIGVCPIDRVTGISKVSKKNKRPTKKLNLEFWEIFKFEHVCSRIFSRSYFYKQDCLITTQIILQDPVSFSDYKVLLNQQRWRSPLWLSALGSSVIFLTGKRAFQIFVSVLDQSSSG